MGFQGQARQRRPIGASPAAHGFSPLTSFVLAAVLLGALIHATWNALIKAQSDKFSASALVAVGAGVVAVPLMVALPAPPSAAWPYIAASAVIHVGYFALVAYAYRSADLGVAYPLTRGTAPPATALFALLLFGETLGFYGWLAVLAIAIGIVTLSADALARGGLTRATAVAALTNAGVIVVYTLVDGLGARVTDSGFIYVAWMLAATAILLLALMLALRGKSFLFAARREWPLALGGGALALDFVRDRALGDDARADRSCRRAARDIGVVRRDPRRCAVQRTVRPEALARARPDRRRNCCLANCGRLARTRLLAILLNARRAKAGESVPIDRLLPGEKFFNGQRVTLARFFE